MKCTFQGKRLSVFKKTICYAIVLNFSFSLILPPSYAQEIFQLPTPGQMVWLSTGFEPTVLKGMTVHAENPLLFDFIVDRGEQKISQDALKDESTKLVKYFLTALTVPDKDSWVNLSPYEQDRIIPDSLGQTEMGQTMLEQDYILKQLSSSLTNPEKDLGEKFWDQVRARTQKEFGNADVEVSTFNKVWIVPDGATIAEKDGFAYITSSHLKVMLEEDYVAMQNSSVIASSEEAKQSIPSKIASSPSERALSKDTADINKLSSDVFRQVILPQLEKEVNEGKNFAATRQVYQSVVLAAWYKKHLKKVCSAKFTSTRPRWKGLTLPTKILKTKFISSIWKLSKKASITLLGKTLLSAPTNQSRVNIFRVGNEWGT